MAVCSQIEYVYPLACGLPATVPNENHENGGLGWSRGALGGALGAILELLGELWEPFWTQERPKLKNHQKSDFEDPPPGTILGAQFLEQIDLGSICSIFLRVFLETRFCIYFM